MTDDEITYCTIVARNYLPQALALKSSIERHEPGRRLTILVLDGDVQLPAHRREGTEIVRPKFLGLPERRFLELATVYDVVELATALKPLLLQKLLEAFKRVVYLDPDTFVVSPLSELTQAIDSSGGVLLTPHFLEPIPPESADVSEIHSLTVGAYNLGFCGVGRAGLPFLSWWWSHLENECLIYPLLGLFVDQKWADVGSVLFPTAPLRHYGYNVGPWNLHERDLAGTAADPRIRSTGEPLRLFHFSGFDPDNPTELSSRLGFSTSSLRSSNAIIEALCTAYGNAVLASRRDIGPSVPYAYAHDVRGRYLTKRLRRVFRAQRLSADYLLPLPFLDSETDAFVRWRRRQHRATLNQIFADMAIAAKYVLPDEYAQLRKYLPRAFLSLRLRLLANSRVRR